jgi:mono/diheme cytochrome c family protein
MRRWTLVAGFVAVLLIVGAAAGLVVVWRPAMATIDPPSPHSFAPDLIRRGRDLAAIGNCNTCHTLRGGGDYAGGVPVPTPFGTVFSTNITPDPDSGIGRWSEAAFARAMKAGVDRDGHHLYPTFPYDHFTNVTDEDIHALYAYLMTRDGVHAAAKPNPISFPFDQRWLLAGWKLLFLRHGTYKTDDTKSAEWNRGAYLVEGLAHCGACHTPRNVLGAERPNAAFAGGEVENWRAYAINTQSPSPVHWDREALYAYLRQGWHTDHGTARGPMAEVVSNLSVVPADDVAAIATYMADVTGPASSDPARQRNAVVAEAARADTATDHRGAALYAAACATCHEGARPVPYGGINLALSTSLSAPDPRNLVNTILAGVRPVEGERSPIMPGFGNSMDDGQIIALISYLRSRFGKGPPWTDLEEIVRQARQMQTANLQTSEGAGSAPAASPQREQP